MPSTGLAVADRTAQRIGQPVAAQAHHGAARRPDAGKDDSGSRLHLGRIVADDGLRAHLRAGPLHTAQIASVVVDDDDGVGQGGGRP